MTHALSRKVTEARPKRAAYGLPPETAA